MSNEKKVYFLCPTWDFHPSGPLRLGSLLISKDTPGDDLNGPDCPRPTPCGPQGTPLAPNSILPPTTQYGVTWSEEKRQAGWYGLWTEFLSLLGLGVTLGADVEKTFFFREISTEKFVPTTPFLQTCLDHSEAARDFVTRSRFRKPLYMVTSIKIARGASASVRSAAGRGVKAAVTVGGTLVGGAPVNIGPEVQRQWGRAESGSFEDAGDFVFAFGLHRIVARRRCRDDDATGGGVEVVGRPVEYTSGAMYDSQGGHVLEKALPLVDEGACGNALVSDFRGSEGNEVLDFDGEEIVCVRPN
ncbi:hypothetical protein OQA88_5872 [Cercophora sp. LCS_1]